MTTEEGGALRYKDVILLGCSTNMTAITGSGVVTSKTLMANELCVESFDDSAGTGAWTSGGGGAGRSANLHKRHNLLCFEVCCKFQYSRSGLSSSKQSDIDSEAADNEKELSRCHGQRVSYGAVIQLRHCASGKFLTVRKHSALRDQACMQAVLEAGGSESSWFQVLPAYKSRAEGQEVTVGDAVVLAAEAVPNGYLHTSSILIDEDIAFASPETQRMDSSSSERGGGGGVPSPPPFSLSSGSFSKPSSMNRSEYLELNIAVEGGFNRADRFIVIGDSRPPKRASASGLKSSTVSADDIAYHGNEVISIYHPECETALVFDMALHDAPIFQRVRNKHNLDSVVTSEPDQNVNAFWEVQSCSIGWAGNALKWNCPYRLLHCASQMYLACHVPSNGDCAANGHDTVPQLCMREHASDVGTEWAIVQSDNHGMHDQPDLGLGGGGGGSAAKFILKSDQLFFKNIATGASLETTEDHSCDASDAKYESPSAEEATSPAMAAAQSLASFASEDTFQLRPRLGGFQNCRRLLDGSLSPHSKHPSFLDAIAASPEAKSDKRAKPSFDFRRHGSEMHELQLSEAVCCTNFDPNNVLSLRSVDKHTARALAIVVDILAQLRHYVFGLLQLDPSEIVGAVSNAAAHITNQIEVLIALCFQRDTDLILQTDEYHLKRANRHGNALSKKFTNHIYQKMLRDMGVAELALEMVVIPFVEKGVKTSSLRSVSKTFQRDGGKDSFNGFNIIGEAAYLLLRVMMMNSPSTKTHMDRYLCWFALPLSSPFCQLGTAMQTVNTMIELFSSNAQLLAQVDEGIIALFTDLLHQNDRFPRYLLFLSVLSECDGVPIARNQGMILDYLIFKKQLSEGNDSTAGVLIKAKPVTEAGRHDICVYEDGGLTEGERLCKNPKGFRISHMKGRTEDVLAANESHLDGEDLAYSFFLQQMLLIIALLKGRNPQAFPYFTEHAEDFAIGYPTLLQALTNTKLPFVYREACLRMIHALYLDQNPQMKVPLIRKTRFWSTNGGTNILAPRINDPYAKWNLPDGSNPFRPPHDFENLQQELRSLIDIKSGDTQKLFASNLPTAVRFQCCIIDMLCSLVSFGFMHLAPEEHVSRLSPSSSVKSPVKRVHPLLFEPDTNEVIDVRGKSINLLQLQIEAGDFDQVAEKILVLLLLLDDLTVDDKLSELIRMYEKSFTEVVRPATSSKPSGSDVIGSSTSAVKQTIDMLGVDAHSFDMNGGGVLEKAMEMSAVECNTWLRVQTASDQANQSDMLNGLVLKILNDSRKTGLHVKAIEMFSRHTSQAQSLGVALSSCQMLIVPKIIASYFTIHESVSEICKHIGALYSVHRERSTSLLKLSDVLDKMTKYCTVGETITNPSTDFVVTVIDRHKFQKVLVNFDIIPTVMQLLDCPIHVEEQSYGNCDKIVDPDAEEVVKMLTAAYALLAALVNKNLPVQELVFTALTIEQSGISNRMVRHMGVDGINAAVTVAATFADSNTNLDALKDSQLVPFLLSMVLDKGQQSRWLVLLQVLASITGVSHTTNANIILSCMLQMDVSPLAMNNVMCDEAFMASQSRVLQKRSTLSKRSRKSSVVIHTNGAIANKLSSLGEDSENGGLEMGQSRGINLIHTSTLAIDDPDSSSCHLLPSLCDSKTHFEQLSACSESDLAFHIEAIRLLAVCAESYRQRLRRLLPKSPLVEVVTMLPNFVSKVGTGCTPLTECYVGLMRIIYFSQTDYNQVSLDVSLLAKLLPVIVGELKRCAAELQDHIDKSSYIETCKDQIKKRFEDKCITVTTKLTTDGTARNSKTKILPVDEVEDILEDAAIDLSADESHFIACYVQESMYAQQHGVTFEMLMAIFVAQQTETSSVASILDTIMHSATFKTGDRGKENLTGYVFNILLPMVIQCTYHLRLYNADELVEKELVQLEAACDMFGMWSMTQKGAINKSADINSTVNHATWLDDWHDTIIHFRQILTELSERVVSPVASQFQSSFKGSFKAKPKVGRPSVYGQKSSQVTVKAISGTTDRANVDIGLLGDEASELVDLPAEPSSTNSYPTYRFATLSDLAAMIPNLEKDVSRMGRWKRLLVTQRIQSQIEFQLSHQFYIGFRNFAGAVLKQIGTSYGNHADAIPSTGVKTLTTLLLENPDGLTQHDDPDRPADLQTMFTILCPESDAPFLNADRVNRIINRICTSLRDEKFEKLNPSVLLFVLHSSACITSYASYCPDKLVDPADSYITDDMWSSFIRTWRGKATVEPRKSDISSLQERKIQSTLTNTCIFALRCCAHPFSESVKTVAFDLLCHMLERGTPNAQLACLRALESGAIAEDFMENIRTTLRQYGQAVKDEALLPEQVQHIVKELHFITVLCQNSKTSQDFLRGVRRGREAASVNIVSELVLLCETLQQHNNFDGVVACEVIETLCAVVQGPNIANQTLLGQTKLFNLVNRFLHMSVMHQKRSEYVKRVVFRGKLHRLLLYLVVGNTPVANENAQKMISEVALLKLAVSINLAYKTYRRYCAFCNHNPDESTLDSCEALHGEKTPHDIRRLLNEELFNAFFIFQHLSKVDTTDEVLQAMQILKLQPGSLQSESMLQGMDCSTPSLNWFDTDDQFLSQLEQHEFHHSNSTFSHLGSPSAKRLSGGMRTQSNAGFGGMQTNKTRQSRKSMLHVDGQVLYQELEDFEDKPQWLTETARTYGLPMPVDTNAMEFLDKYTANIEIVAQDGTLCSIFFPLHPQIVSMFGGKSRMSTADGVLVEKMLRNVHRDDPSKRSIETLQQQRAASIHLNHLHLLRQSPFNLWVYLNGHNLEYIGGALTVVFYIMVLLLQRFSTDGWTFHLGIYLQHHVTVGERVLIFCVLFVHNIVCVLVWYRYTIANVPEQFELKKESQRIALIKSEVENKKNLLPTEAEKTLDKKLTDMLGAAEQVLTSSENFIRSFSSSTEESEERWSSVLIDLQNVHTLRSHHDLIRPVSFTEAFVNLRFRSYLAPVIFTVEFWYRLCFMLFSLLTTILAFANNKYCAMFMAYHVSVVFLSAFGIQLITSIRFASKNIGMVLLTHLILLIILCVFNYFVLYEHLSCDTTFGCMYETIRYGMMEGSKTALYYTGVASPTFSAAPALTYMIIFYIGWFMPKILQAQLVDALAQMRMKERAQIEDDNAKCFICTRAWNEFESALHGGFDTHIKDQHDPIAYFGFLFYLKFLQSPMDYDLNEKYVQRKIDRNDSSWLPLLRSIAIENHHAAQEQSKSFDDTNSRLSKIETSVMALTQSMESLIAQGGSETPRRDQSMSP